MTISIHFHQSSYRTFKDYYIKNVCENLTDYFPKLVSYNRMVELMPNVLTACLYYLNSRQGRATGISFVDNTAIPVCHPKRISRNKVFKETAKLSKSSMGWYFGFKLHLIINDCGDILSCKFTPGNVDDRTHLPSMTQGISGQIFGDIRNVVAANPGMLGTVRQMKKIEQVGDATENQVSHDLQSAGEHLADSSLVRDGETQLEPSTIDDREEFQRRLSEAVVHKSPAKTSGQAMQPSR